jgi:hypothetical protein
MTAFVIVAVLGGSLLGQQPQGLVTQTELPPPGADTAKSRVEAAPAPAPQPAQKPAEKTRKTRDGKEAAPAGAKSTEPKSETPLADVSKKPAGAKRVAAFWIIIPGR